MARPSKGKMLESLEGRLRVLRQEVQKILRDLKREIAKREVELAALKARYQKGLALLQGQARVVAARSQRKARRAPQLDWKQIFSTLPNRFTLDALIRHPQAGKRPKPHLYAIVSRWKKEKKLVADQAGSYRKLGAPAKKVQASVPKPPRPQRPEPPAA